MNLKELVLLERSNQIPLLPKEPHSRAMAISAFIGKSWNPTLTQSVNLDYEQAIHMVDRENAEKSEKEERDREIKVKEVSKELFKMACGIRCWETPWNEKIPLDGKMTWRDLRSFMSVRAIDEQTAKRLAQETCPKAGQKIDLSDALDNFLTDLAEKIVKCSRKIPSLVELDRLLADYMCDPLRVHCGEDQGMPGRRCLGVLSEFGDHCHSLDLKLVPK